MSAKKTNRIRTRDYNLLLIIGGATKAGSHRNYKKENSRFACREWENDNDDYYDVDIGFRGVVRRGNNSTNDAE